MVGIPLSGNLSLTNRELEEVWHDHERLEILQRIKKLKICVLRDHFFLLYLKLLRGSMYILENFNLFVSLLEVND